MKVRRLLGLASGALERFFAAQPQQGMVICRVAFGLILFACYASRLPYLQQLFGPQGVDGFATHQRTPALPAGRPLEANLQLLHLVPSEEVILGLYLLLLLASLAFALGVLTRASGLVALLLHALLVARNYAAFAGWATMLVPWLLYVILSPAGRFASLGARLRRGAGGPPGPWIGPAWPVRLLQMHLCTMYASAGLVRFLDPSWLHGEMVFQILNDRFYGRFDLPLLGLKPILIPLSYGVFVLEPLAPILLWIRRTRTPCVLALMGLHLGMEVFADTGWWQPMMIAALTVFLPWRGGPASEATPKARKAVLAASGPDRRAP